MTKAEKALERLAESRRALKQAIGGLNEAEMTRAQVEGTWTIKDVLGHIASWDETCLKPLRRYAAEGGLEVEVIQDYLAWNDEQAARKRDILLKAIVEDMAAIRREMVDLANTLPPEQWERQIPFPWGGAGTLAQALSGLAIHEREHAQVIHEWRKGD